MLEKIGHIKNPLTVIAMFAGIAELSGTVVLPFLEKPIQEVYVWFLMGFPVLMVYLFYKTLWRDHTVLYAPSDFQKDESFMQAHFKSYSDDHVGAPFPEFSAEAEPVAADAETCDMETSDTSALPKSLPIAEPEKADAFSEDVGEHSERSRYLQFLGRRRVLSKISRTINGAYHSDVEPKQLPNVKFDAVVESPYAFCVVGFVFMGHGGYSAFKDMQEKINDASLFWDTLSDEEKSKFSIHIALMRERSHAPLSDRVLRNIKIFKSKYPFKIDITEYTYAAKSLVSKRIED